VRTFRPSRAGVVHEAGYPFCPSISTRQSRHDPNGSSESVAHSFGILIPASAAARITDDPSGTAIGRPSISSVTMSADWQRGVEKSLSWRDRIRIHRVRSSHR